MIKVKRLSAIIITLFILILTSCSSSSDTIKDREGKDIVLPNKIERIISTAPSNTEILVELGLGDKIVAIDTFSEGIKGIKSDIPKIDFTNPDNEKLISLKPDLIIASEINKTGSIGDPLSGIEESGVTTVYIPTSNSIEDIYKDIEFIASVTAKKEKGEEIVNRMKKDIDKIKNIAKGITNKKKVYFEIGSEPTLYSFGSETFLNEIIEVIGAENILKDQKSWVSPTDESIIKKNPDVILTNESYIENATDLIKNRNGWENINAIKEKNVHLIDLNTSSRPSQNIIKALNEIAKAVYPEKYAN